MSPSPLDICTLVWLCKGDVGAEDVRRLPNSHEAMKIVLDPNLQDDSARLDRLLLLLQFGARIERPVRIGTKTRSILAWFMRSYRPAKIPNVARKVCERYVRAVDDPATAKNMVEKHMEGALEPLHTALLDFEADRESYDKTAYDLLHATFDWMSKSTRQRQHQRPARQLSFRTGNETTPLLTGRREDEDEEVKCPPGWKSHAKGGPYEESLTRSVTFRRPR